DLNAVHIIAHGAPGRICFAAGEWSAATLASEAKYLAAVGRALAVGGQLRLWSCASAAGSLGSIFVEAIARATGADVAASTGRVGTSDRGGSWELDAPWSQVAVLPPLSELGVAVYAGVLAAFDLTVTVTTLAANTYFVLDTTTGNVVAEFTLVGAVPGHG